MISAACEAIERLHTKANMDTGVKGAGNDLTQRKIGRHSKAATP